MTSINDQFTSHQATLPRLPIPNLPDSLTKLLKWSRALLTPEERLESEKAVSEFLNSKEPDQGTALQTKLIDYDKTSLLRSGFAFVLHTTQSAAKHNVMPSSTGARARCDYRSTAYSEK